MAVGSLAAFVGACAGQQQVTLHGYSGTAIVSTDGRTVIVGPYGLACGATVTAVARESLAKVSLFMQYVSGGPACLSGEGTMAMVPWQRIRLHAPLGRRALVDGATGAATAWLSASLVLRPRLVPAGFRSAGLVPWMSLSLYLSAARSAACTQTYRTKNELNELVIIQSSAGMRLRAGGDWAPIFVRGHAGRAATGMITWHEHGLTDLISSSGLTTSQLVAIANSAPA